MNRKILVIFLLTLIYFVNLYFYIDGLHIFSNKENVLTSYDGYYYAYLAKKLLEDSYKAIDYLTNVPDFSIFPYPVPMHSYIAYILVKFLNIKLETIIIWTSVILAPLFIFSMYLYTRKFLPIYAFIGGAILGSLNPVYFGRNVPGRFDTDSLILFFIFLILFLIVKLIENLKNLKVSIIYTLTLIISFNLFMWWYKKPLFADVFLVSIILGAISYYYKEIKNNKILLKNFLLNITIYIVALWSFAKIGIFDAFNKVIFYTFKQPEASSFIPESIKKHITELQPVSWNTFLMAITDNTMLTIIGIVGLILIFKNHFKYISVAIPIIAIGILSFKSGVRFLMYLIPFIGLGVGYFYYSLYKFLTKKLPFLNKGIYKLALILLIIISSFPVSIGLIKPRLIIDNETFYSLKEVKEKLDNKSYIWHTWSYGYPLKYLLDRGVYVDNGNQNIIKNFAIANSLYTTSLEKSYKLISFITNHFFDEYSKLSLKEFDYKVNNYTHPPKNTVYMFLTKRMLFEVETTRQGVYNTDIKNFEIPMVKNIAKCEFINKSLYDCKKFIFNANTKTLLWTPSLVELKKEPSIIKTVFVDRAKQVVEEIDFKLKTPSEKKWILEIIHIPEKQELYFSYIIPVFYNTTFNKLFFLSLKNPLFEKIYDNFPYIVVFKAKN